MLHWRSELPWQMLGLSGRRIKDMVVIFWHLYSNDSLLNTELHIFKFDLYSTSLERLDCCIQFGELVMGRDIGKLGPN